MAESNPFMRISYRACRLRRRLVASSRRSAPRLLANDADLGLCRDLRGEAEEPGPGGAVAEGAFRFRDRPRVPGPFHNHREASSIGVQHQADCVALPCRRAPGSTAAPAPADKRRRVSSPDYESRWPNSGQP